MDLFVETLQLLNRDHGEPTLDLVQKQLLKLGDAEGKMKALEVVSSSATSGGDGGQPHLTQLLKTSQEVFHKTFQEYVRIWNAVPDRADAEEVLQLWHDSLEQCRHYLNQPIPGDESQLVSDSSLCSVHHNILQGQGDSLSTLVEQRPSDFAPIQDQYNQLEADLAQRQDATSLRLRNWSEYKAALDALSIWLQQVEQEKQTLQLPFLSMGRIPHVKQQIEVSILPTHSSTSCICTIKLCRPFCKYMVFCRSSLVAYPVGKTSWRT